MRNLKNMILAKTLINKTGKTLQMYDEYTGQIRRFEVSKQKLQKLSAKDLCCKKITSYYVYNEEKFKKIADSDRDLDDIAVLLEPDQPSLGRNGKEIDYLVWGKDLQTAVRYSCHAS